VAIENSAVQAQTPPLKRRCLSLDFTFSLVFGTRS